MSAELRTKVKNNFEKDFFKLMSNSVFGKTMENVREHKNIKLVANSKNKSCLVSEPSYHTAKWFLKKLVAIEMNKTKMQMNKSVYFALLILDISKIAMYEYLSNGMTKMKPKCGDKGILCYTDTGSFIVYPKFEKFYVDLAGDVEASFDTSNFEVDRLLPTGKNKKVMGLMKDELGGRIMK